MIRQQGFTLLEVMVATVILAVGLGTIGGAISTAVRSTALATAYERARQVAESELALFLAGQPDEAERRKGDDGTISWQLEASPDPELEGLLQIRIEARFFAAGGERSVVLETREMTRILPESDDND